MVSDKYKDKLLEQKFQSMKQLDRIEFRSMLNQKEIYSSLVINIILNYHLIGIIFLVSGLFIISLDKFIGMFSIFIGIIFTIFSFFLAFKFEKKWDKENETKLDKFIEEHSKK